MRVLDRFLKYIQYDTASDSDCPDCPSSPGQRVFAEALVDEMRSLGIQDARVDGHGYVYGSIPATDDALPIIGLIAHMDVVSDLPCQPMNARVVANYDGGDIALNEEGDVLSPDQFPDLTQYAGQTLVVTDGHTILGADDKAGIAEILTACELLINDPTLRHGRVAIAFTPDEEIGRGADLFDVKGFGAAYAYTVDGGALGEIEYETFNAASAGVAIQGVNIHPGTAKNKMKNATLIGMELNGLLPAAQRPEHTEGYEGFFLLTKMSGSVEQCAMHYIIRDHDRPAFEARKGLMADAVEFLNRKHGEGTVTLTLKDSYYNMREVLKDRLDIVEKAEAAMTRLGIAPIIGPVRGGTDGSRLSFMGLPCPNLSTGGMNGHGKHECVVVESMEKMVEVLVALLCPA